ncbi:DUF3168 domain-containing protein [Acinetobacter baumannii]|nr:DUF3168 domain-containing protein [Acinetobacter baumannii]EKU6331826.1 DUF3168 domain-containing protein [Acinetobacter baumannii]EKW4748677.1 DUF3168 domain-containing protein [Acinetobacter baumannii]EKW4753277.1 DUF3168 domain-containing protein [Acinetobacter baumannii]EKX1173408.1 DUF3168 domain-containing protein [Acinetobacter baumannii]
MSDIPIFRILNANSKIKALLGEDLKVYEDVAPSGIEPPYAVWQIITASSENYLDSQAKLDHVMYQVIVYDTDVIRATAIRAAIRSVLGDHSYILNSMINGKETQTKLFSRGFDANWFVKRKT